jgi:hypothetical protein
MGPSPKASSDLLRWPERGKREVFAGTVEGRGLFSCVESQYGVTEALDVADSIRGCRDTREATNPTFPVWDCLSSEAAVEVIRIDVDHRRPLPLGRLAWLVTRAGYRLRWMTQRRSPSGRGWHCEIQVTPNPTPLETVALQAILGSDRGREACNLSRARMVTGRRVPAWWASRWNVLYRERGKRS